MREAGKIADHHAEAVIERHWDADFVLWREVHGLSEKETVVEKIESTGNKNVWVCERGYTFGYNNLIVDYRNFPIMKTFGNPIVFDATHSVQRPGGQGDCSGGDREFVSSLAASAVAQGIAGVFLEVHDEPEKALCDGPNSIRTSQLEEFLKYLIDLDAWVKSRKFPEIS